MPEMAACLTHKRCQPQNRLRPPQRATNLRLCKHLKFAQNILQICGQLQRQQQNNNNDNNNITAKATTAAAAATAGGSRKQ